VRTSPSGHAKALRAVRHEAVEFVSGRALLERPCVSRSYSISKCPPAGVVFVAAFAPDRVSRFRTVIASPRMEASVPPSSRRRTGQLCRQKEVPFLIAEEHPDTSITFGTRVAGDSGVLHVSRVRVAV
jgi:hypothetical protein